MSEYKQFYTDGNATFCSESLVSFSHCAPDGKMSLNELLRLASDTAVEAYNVLGMSREFLVENGYAILVSRLAFRFHKMPSENQKITLTTWEESAQSFQLMRQYEIKDSQTGEKLITGYSGWLCVSPQERKIIPATKFNLRPLINRFEGHDCMDPKKIILPDGMELAEKRTIKYSDLDTNGHTNNSRYAAFFVDAIKDEYKKKTFTDFRINFSHEALYNDEIEIYVSYDDENKKIIAAGKIKGETSFECELYWK